MQVLERTVRNRIRISQVSFANMAHARRQGQAVNVAEAPPPAPPVQLEVQPGDPGNSF